LNTFAPNTSIDIIFFDFDGTLVDSAAIKRNCFYSVFPNTPECRSTISAVLLENREASRYEVIPRMIEEMLSKGLPVLQGTTVEIAIETYTSQVLAAVLACDEMPGAGRLLHALSTRCSICIVSNTPESDLRNLVKARKWHRLVRSVDGYPCRKSDIIRDRLSGFGFSPNRALVVGDGRSDEEAAEANGCAFYEIAYSGDLLRLAATLGIENVC
jgi:phosphoglycolate phosphatase-like HAD superfamily hydrolase